MAGRQYQAQQQKRQSDAAALTASMGPRGGDIHPPLPSVSIGDRIADVLGSAVSQYVEGVKTIPSYLSAVGEAVTPHIKGAASQYVEGVRNTPA